MSYIIEEIASYLLVGDDSIEGDECLEDRLKDEFHINFNILADIVNRLLPMCLSAPAGISGTKYCGFADKKRNVFIARVEE